MAAQEGTPSPSAQVVGNAFVEQYYHILHQSPALVHRFYQDSSLLSRPGINGTMTTVTTMQAINDKILSLNYGDYTAEIKTADAQESHEKGVIVLVTGCLTGKDNVRKKFTQTFFLAPQDKGYFVLNDVFRFVEEGEPLQRNAETKTSINENAQTADVTPEPEPVHGADHLQMERAITIEGEDFDNGAEVCDPSDKDDGSVIEEEEVEPPSNSVQNEIHTGVDSAPVSLDDAPKKSYASIVKVMKGNTVSTRAYVRTGYVRSDPANTDQQSVSAERAAPAPAPEASAPSIEAAPESSNVSDEAEGCSIYVRNLPFSAKPPELEEVFKKFGPIRKNGIQVRSNKQGYCFGFVAFENPSSVQSALEVMNGSSSDLKLESGPVVKRICSALDSYVYISGFNPVMASPVIIGDRQADVEAKRANSRVGSSGRGRFSSGRGGFRNDNFKGRGNFGGGRGYGRSEYRSQGEFSGRPKGSVGRTGDGRGNQNGNRRGGHQGGENHSTTVSAA